MTFIYALLGPQCHEIRFPPRIKWQLKFWIINLVMNWAQYLSLETKQLGLKLALPFFIGVAYNQ